MGRSPTPSAHGAIPLNNNNNNQPLALLPYYAGRRPFVPRVGVSRILEKILQEKPVSTGSACASRTTPRAPPSLSTTNLGLQLLLSHPYSTYLFHSNLFSNSADDHQQNDIINSSNSEDELPVSTTPPPLLNESASHHELSPSNNSLTIIPPDPKFFNDLGKETFLQDERCQSILRSLEEIERSQQDALKARREKKAAAGQLSESSSSPQEKIITECLEEIELTPVTSDLDSSEDLDIIRALDFIEEEEEFATRQTQDGDWELV